MQTRYRSLENMYLTSPEAEARVISTTIDIIIGMPVIRQHGLVHKIPSYFDIDGFVDHDIICTGCNPPGQLLFGIGRLPSGDSNCKTCFPPSGCNKCETSFSPSTRKLTLRKFRKLTLNPFWRVFQRPTPRKGAKCSCKILGTGFTSQKTISKLRL